MSTNCRIDPGKGRTGAGFRIVTAPLRAAPRHRRFGRRHRNFKLGEHYRRRIESGFTPWEHRSGQELIRARVNRDAVIPAGIDNDETYACRRIAGLRYMATSMPSLR